ncbi:MAG: thioredoxin domain-containing protein [Deltaproteobacteria bacterium]|nr:thioredoxin domain-containing protein [Deltaproteobacteria bacterium]
MRRWALWWVVGFSVLGIIGSLIATHQYFQILQTGFETKSFCNISEFINCDAAYASSEAKFAGIPVSWLGFIFYLWSGLLALWILVKKSHEQVIASLGWLMALFGVLISIYKAYVSIYVLNVLCLICSSMYLVNLVMFAAWHKYLGLGVKHWSRLQLKTKFIPLSLATLVLFGLGGMLISNYQEQFMREAKLPVSTEEVVAFHFRQSQYQFEPSANAPVWGNPNAKVTVVEFSDFQCPFCKYAAFHLKPVLSEFKNKVRFYFYNYPLDASCNKQIQGGMHDKACMAAYAAECAAQFGDFWDYHDAIFRNQKDLSRELLLNLAKKEGWNVDAFEKCVDSPETKKRVEENIEAGNKIYVTGTPTVLVNNRRVKYWTNPDVFRAILKEEIARSK